MVKSSGSGMPAKEQYTVHSGVAKEYAGDRYYRQNEQRDRWLAEHQHNESVEKALAYVSKFSYDPVDYVRFLVKEPFREPPRQEYQSLLPERLLAAEKKFRQPITRQWAGCAIRSSEALPMPPSDRRPRPEDLPRRSYADC